MMRTVNSAVARLAQENFVVGSVYKSPVERLCDVRPVNYLNHQII